MEEIEKHWELFNSMISFVVDNGRRVKFWKDRWCSEEPLCEIFPSLFALSNSKEAWVVDLWEHRGEGGNWNFRFVRNLNDWELGAMEHFLSLLQGSVKREQEDRVVWKGGNKGVFSVREWLYNPVPFKNSVEPLDSIKGEFFHLGGLLGKVFDFGPTSKKRVDFGQ